MRVEVYQEQEEVEVEQVVRLRLRQDSAGVSVIVLNTIGNWQKTLLEFRDSGIVYRLNGAEVPGKFSFDSSGRIIIE